MLSLYLAALESDGDKKQFRELYRRYHRVMERTALAVLHDPHDAEEAVQEAFLRVIENFSKIDEIFPNYNVNQRNSRVAINQILVCYFTAHEHCYRDCPSRSPPAD